MYTVRREQPQIGKNSVLTDKPQRALLLLPQGDIFLCEKALRILKGQFLIQGTGRLIVIAVRLFDHFQNGAPGGRNRGCTLPDKDSLRAQSFGCEIIRAGGALLDVDRNHVLAIHLPLFAQQNMRSNHKCKEK